MVSYASYLVWDNKCSVYSDGTTGPEDEDATTLFTSFRKGPVNCIAIYKSKFFFDFAEATDLCRRSAEKHTKEGRIRVFRSVLYDAP